MDPDDIPTEITKLADTSPYYLKSATVPVILAHFWLAIEAHIREQVAQEIEAAIDRNRAEYSHIEAMRARRLGLRQAARIARSETWDGSAPAPDAQ